MRHILLITSLILSCAVEAKQRVNIATDLIPEGGIQKADLVSGFMYQITESLSDKYDFNYELASREREWRLLEQNSNLCLYNKQKSPERVNLAYYAASPLIIYPPNRLIVTKPLPWTSEISLSQLLEDRPMRIGVINGRRYSEQIDRLIRNGSRHFYQGAGSQKAERLHTMLLQGKLDGIIEYASVFKSRQLVDKNTTPVFTYALVEAKTPVEGYIACSKSALGKQVILDIQNVMATPSYQGYVINALQNTPALPEADYIIEMLGYQPTTLY